MSFSIPKRWKLFSFQYPELVIGRIILQEKGIYRICTEQGKYTARISGKFQFDANSMSDYPTVGDYVMVSYADADMAIIHQVLPRKSLFIRKAAGTSKVEQAVAANIDTVFICMSLNNDFNLRRLERYLAVTWESGAEPVVVLTKSDLCKNLPQRQSEAENIAIGVNTLTVSCMDPYVRQHLLTHIPEDSTIAFIGSSGVGKSTLINCLLEGNLLATDSLRNDDKGHHTTTHRELLFLSNGAMVIDTPGMRELGMWDTSDGIEQTFADIEKLTLLCRFNNCSHTKEPGCAVRTALENGKLDAERWYSYQKLKAENFYASDSTSYLEMKERKFKKIAKINKHNKNR